AIESRLRGLVAAPLSGDLLVAPRGRFKHAPAINNVVRAAWLVPIADRRVQRNRLPIERHPPVRWRKWSHDLVATPAAAAVHRRRVLHGDIEYATFQLLGHLLDKTMRKARMPDHSMSSSSSSRSSFRRRLPSVVNVE